jgi:hypothetical protein
MPHSLALHVIQGGVTAADTCAAALMLQIGMIGQVLAHVVGVVLRLAE